MHQHAHQVVARRLRAAVRDHPQGVLRILEPGPRRARGQLGGRRRRGRRQHLLGPAQQPVAVLGRHAQQVADHDHRQRRGDLAHEVAAALFADCVDQLRHDPPDLRLVILDAALGEALVDERAPELVLRVVHVDHRRQRRGIRARAHARAEKSWRFRDRHHVLVERDPPQPARLVPVHGRVLAHPAEVREGIADVEAAIEQSDRGVLGMIGHVVLSVAIRTVFNRRPARAARRASRDPSRRRCCARALRARSTRAAGWRLPP